MASMRNEVHFEGIHAGFIQSAQVGGEFNVCTPVNLVAGVGFYKYATVPSLAEAAW